MAIRSTQHKPEDIKLLQSRPIFTNFGQGTYDDVVEFHVLSGDNVLDSKYAISGWATETSETKNTSPSIKLNIHQDIRNVGYRSGVFTVKYNFLNLKSKFLQTLY